ncbi:MAG: VWA domain-containing protein [Burkholderiaceae bacterium]|nr:VWA domain-containing protein [Burkholderiaceae bacterium]
MRCSRGPALLAVGACAAGGRPWTHLPAVGAGNARQAPYDLLAALPPALHRAAVTTACGTPPRRLADLARWRAALAAGRLPPPEADLGDAQAMAAMRAVAAAQEVASACRALPALVDVVLATLLWHLDRIVDLQPRLARADAIAQAAAELRAQWESERGDWDEALALLQGLGDLGALQWDRLRGRLRGREWQAARRAQLALARLPELVALIRRLGRAERAGDAPAQEPPPAETPPRRFGVKAVETRLPGLPGELRGIRLSGRIEGMLASEAVMLHHPLLKKLWRARHAEARLLAYDSEAVLRDWRPDPLAPPAAGSAPPRPERRERGPIVLCLDTSGSMRGAPETIAKAVVLETLATAQRERRGCVLIAFGGEGEIVERALGTDAGGLDALLDLMGQGFDGGTDLQSPVERAVARVHEAGWRSADMLLVSDGEFGCMPSTLELLDAARERLGLRVQGVLVGDRETMGLLELCDDIFWVRDWRRHGDEADAAAPGFSPVHSKSLTAMYFPGALSPRAARHLRPDGGAR